MQSYFKADVHATDLIRLREGGPGAAPSVPSNPSPGTRLSPLPTSKIFLHNVEK